MSKKSKPLADIAAEMSNSAESVVIAQPKFVSVALEIEGTAHLIQNAFSQKAIEEMLRKHMGLTVQREKKKPREVIENAIVRNTDGGVCMPVTSVKAAMLTASTQLKTFERKKTMLMTSLFIEGGALPITFDRMTPRMDMVRTAGMNRTPDVRFRPQFEGWKARLVIQFVDGLLQVQSVVDLVQRAGRVGIGEWRPEKRGTHGTFRVSRHISDSKEIEEVRAQCATPLKTPQIPSWALDMEIDPTILAKAFGEAASGDSEEAEETVETEVKNGARHKNGKGAEAR